MAITTRPPDAVAPVGPPFPAPAPGVRGPLARLWAGARERWRWLAVAAVVVAGTLTGIELAGAAGTYRIQAVFARAPGLFAGAAVEELGVQVGTVTSVRNVGDHVQVLLAVDDGRAIPARASASLVSPELLGEPSIELAPGYTSGPILRPGATIPESRTAVPVSTEQVLKDLESTLNKLNPKAVGGLIANLAQDLTGQGQNLNTLIHGAAGTLSLLATKADDLGQLSGSLAQLTGALDARTAQISQLVTDYDTVSGVIAQHSTQLGGAITELSQASSQVVELLAPNLSTIETDVGGVTSVGRTVDRNLTSVDEILTSATALFAAAQRAYTGTHAWVDLNLQTPAGVTGAYLAGLVRDRLAGVCRRLAANHSSGLTTAQLATLATCGNPRSSFFDPIIGEIPTILDDVAGGQVPAPSTSPAQMLQQGLAQIPGLSQAPAQSAGSAGATPETATTAPPTTTTTAPPSGAASTCLDGVLGDLLTCTSTSGAGSGSTSGPGSGSTTTTTTAPGLGGLLSYDVPVTAPAPSTAPSLTTPAARMLPSLPRSAPGATATRASALRRRHRDKRSR